MRLAIRFVPLLLLLLQGSPAPGAAPRGGVLPAPGATARRAPAPAPASVRARGDRFEIVSAGRARPFFVRGVNLGAGAPGRFPGEFAITKDDYRRWLGTARRLRANAIRVYALHPPAFYRALLEENDAHPADPIWLFQEVWTELPERNDFWDAAFTRGFEDEIRLAVDALHGNAVVAPRPGHAAGRYDADVSPYLAGWLLGREWEPYAVRVTEERHRATRSFRGAYFGVDGGTPMECWLARICETTSSYEAKRYGVAHAVSFVNWPTLDPMRHPTESERGGVQAEHDEDAFSVDPTRIRPTRPIGSEHGFLGYFANYHVYPYYPDFMNLDPGYSAHRDRHGLCNYAGYLTELKARTAGIPLLIGEVGVPSSRGIAHLQPQGIHHGGMSEEEQGARNVRLIEDIESTGGAGVLLFALFDEWFKVNWLVQRLETPRDRDPLWHNLLDPEESYGLIGFDPPPAIRIDGSADDWAGIAPYATAPEYVPGAGPSLSRATAGRSVGAPLKALYVTSDASRFYIRLDLAPGALGRAARDEGSPRPGAPRFRGEPLRTLGVALDVLDSARGDRRLPPPLAAKWSRGAEYVIVIEPGPNAGRGTSADRRIGRGRAELFIDRSTNYSDFSRVLVGGRFERNQAPFRPVANEDGRFVPLLIETNRERVARDGTVYRPLHLDWGRLTEGREPRAAPAWPGADSAVAYDPHAEWAIDPAGRVIELALPWGLLGIGDPSSRCVVDDRDRTRETECTATEGIALLAWATSVPGFSADSLGPSPDAGARRSRPGEVQFVGVRGTTQTIVNEALMVSAPAGGVYSWSGWESPITRERIKRSAVFIQKAFEGMESRDQARRSGFETRRR